MRAAATPRAWHGAVLAVALPLAACGDAGHGARGIHVPGPNDAPPVTVASDTAGGLIRYGAERDVDVTGDSVRDRVVVSAIGPRYDSLTIRLEIQSRDGTPLYVDQWNSRRYFTDTPRPASDTAARRIVLGRLAALLADSAVTPGAAAPRARIDTSAVEFDLREIVVRARHGLANGTPLTGALRDSVRYMRVPKARVDSAIAQLRAKPRFAYTVGGGVTYTVAWDPKLAQFVRVQSCC